MLHQNPIHQWRPFFQMVGLAVSLGITLVAFEWKTYDDNTLVDLGTITIQDEELTLPPVTQQIIEPPTPTVRAPKIVTVKDEELVAEINLEITEFEEDFIVEEYVADDLAEEPQEEIVEDKVFEVVEEAAVPKGGRSAFYKWVNDHIKYPIQPKRMGVEGKVYVQFIVDKDGRLTDLQVVRGIHEDCDAEAIRVLKKAPKWIPAKQRGRPVRQRMVLPIYFKIAA
ncbi:TonB family protein [Limibacter armeniacum]|uniref:energy transducer TonB n=1 Tax=Limibacter armeniacum TaxID=466084 RepID=UPI002FE58D9F